MVGPTNQFNGMRSVDATRQDAFAMVVHDLRNYLNAISLSISVLDEEECEGPSDRRKVMERMQSCARQMDRLIEDLLDASRLSCGRFALRPAWHRAERLVRDAVALMLPVAEKRGLVLDAEVAESIEGILADGDALSRVFANLIGNAIKFTPAGGTITVRADYDPAGVRFAVSDTGDGIEDDDLPHVFERFWQSNGHTVPGAGLGLAIAKGIVEAHGGRIWVESVRGIGTTFYFTVPADEAEPRKVRPVRHMRRGQGAPDAVRNGSVAQRMITVDAS